MTLNSRDSDSVMNSIGCRVRLPGLAVVIGKCPDSGSVRAVIGSIATSGWSGGEQDGVRIPLVEQGDDAGLPQAVVPIEHPDAPAPDSGRRDIDFDGTRSTFTPLAPSFVETR